MEGDPCDGLGDQEEEDDVNAEQSAEIPGRGVDGVTVAEQDDRAGREQWQLSGGGGVDAGTDDRVAAGFQNGRQEQDE